MKGKGIRNEIAIAIFIGIHIRIRTQIHLPPHSSKTLAGPSLTPRHRHRVLFRRYPKNNSSSKSQHEVVSTPVQQWKTKFPAHRQVRHHLVAIASRHYMPLRQARHTSLSPRLCPRQRRDPHQPAGTPRMTNLKSQTIHRPPQRRVATLRIS